MSLPIKLSASTQSKLEEERLLEQAKATKKAKLSFSNDIDLIENVRKNIEETLAYRKHFFKWVTDLEELEHYIERANKYGYVAIDTETTGLNPMTCDILGFSLYFPGDKAIYVPLNHIDYMTYNRISIQLTVEQVIPVLKKLNAKAIMHNAPFDIRVILHTMGIYIPCYWDTQSASFLLNENESHKLKDQHSKYISHKKEYSFGDLFGEEGVFIKIPIELAYIYGANDSMDTFELYEFQFKYLNDKETTRQDLRDLYWLFRNIEMPMVDVIVMLEENGVAVDMNFLDEMSNKYHKVEDEAKARCYAELQNYESDLDIYKAMHPYNKLSEPLNIASDEQLCVLFYDILHADKDNSKLRNKKVDEDAMNILSEKYPIAKRIIEYRKAHKLTSTYIDNIYNILAPDGRLHTSFKSMGAVTGRMCSREPYNLQNVPSRGKAKELRKLFVGQTTYRNIEVTDTETVEFGREEEIETANGWEFVELLKPGDVLVDGETVVDITVDEFKVIVTVRG